jgi:hypothetical protein
MRRKAVDPEARGFVCAVKRAAVIGAKDQRTTSGPADSILHAKGRRHDRTHDQRNAEIALDQRAHVQT